MNQHMFPCMKLLMKAMKCFVKYLLGKKYLKDVAADDRVGHVSHCRRGNKSIPTSFSLT